MKPTLVITARLGSFTEDQVKNLKSQLESMGYQVATCMGSSSADVSRDINIQPMPFPELNERRSLFKRVFG